MDDTDYLSRNVGTDTSAASERPVALVTGGSRGIGRATSMRLAAANHHVVINFRRNAEAAQTVVNEVQATGGSASAVQADLGIYDDVVQLLDRIRREHGRLDVLVANAAASAFRELNKLENRHVEKTFAITVNGFLGLVREANDLLVDGGRVVAVSGWDSFRVLPGHGLLGAAKAAMETLVRYLAVELAPRGILVVGVSPGPVDTDSFRFYASEEWDDYSEEWLPRTPLGRFPGPDEIAAIIDFLASPANSWITGQTIVADGGLSLTTMASEVRTDGL